MEIGKTYSADEIIGMMKAQFGNAVKSYWFYNGDLCPCCQASPITEGDYEGKKALSINAFMYRERGALIAYFLCGECMGEIMAEDPNGPMPKHKAVEGVLTVAYLKHLNSMT